MKEKVRSMLSVCLHAQGLCPCVCVHVCVCVCVCVCPQVRLLCLPSLDPAPGAAPILTSPGECVCCVCEVSMKTPEGDTSVPLLATGTAFALGK